MRFPVLCLVFAIVASIMSPLADAGEYGSYGSSGSAATASYGSQGSGYGQASYGSQGSQASASYGSSGSQASYGSSGSAATGGSGVGPVRGLLVLRRDRVTNRRADRAQRIASSRMASASCATPARQVQVETIQVVIENQAAEDQRRIESGDVQRVYPGPGEGDYHQPPRQTRKCTCTCENCTCKDCNCQPAPSAPSPAT